jgi:RNA polymerase sigma-70 factor (ECF subfamily)
LLFRSAGDSELVRRAGRGDVDAYNVLVSRWEKKLYNYLLRATGNRDDAMDLAQEAFFKAYRGLSSLGEAEKFPQWLFRIAHNLACSKFRSDGRRPQAESEAWPEEGEESASRGLGSTGLSVPLASGSRAFPMELELMVAAALEELPSEQREAVLLKVVHGFKFAEVAEILACPVSTVKSRIYTGLEQLKRSLGAADTLTPQKAVASDE